MLGFVRGSWSRGLCPLVQNLRRLLASAEPFSWQAEGPQCPFGLLFAPCRRAEVLSWGFATRNVALGSALDSAEGLWHLKYADSSAGTRISPRKIWQCC